MKVKVGEITKIKTGKLDANASSENGKYPFFTCSKEPLKIDTYSYDCECVLVAGNGELNVKYYNGKFDAYQRTYIIEDNSNGLLYMPYLYYFFEKYVEELRKQSIGGIIKYIKLANLTDALIELPSIEEQKLIVSLLDSPSKLISLRKDNIKKLDLLIKARFIEMFGNPESNEKGWKKERLGDVCRVINGRAYKATELLDQGKYKVLRVGNFFTNDSWYYSDLELEEDKYCNYGDLLFAWSASFGPKIWLGDKVIYHYHIWKLDKYQDALNKVFFKEHLNYNCELMKGNTHGSTMQHFTKEQMENQGLIVPPLELQNQFASLVEQIDKSKFIFSNLLFLCHYFSMRFFNIILIYHCIMHSCINLRMS